MLQTAKSRQVDTYWDLESVMMLFNFGNILETLEATVDADADALICGEHRISWEQLGVRSNNLARAMLQQGASPGDKVGFYMRNCNEYMELLAACFKARLTHVNVNYRYLADELWYILDNSDATVVVYSSEFRDRLDEIRRKLPNVKLWLEVGDADVPDFASSYENAASSGDGGALSTPEIGERSPSDLLFLYTGGTTGYPKAVMWEHNAIFNASGRTLEHAKANSLAEYAEIVRRNQPGIRQLPACPMMHGTGLFTAMNTMLTGGCVVSIPSARFDAEQLWDTVERQRVNALAIVGDAFAQPMVKALDEHPNRWNLDSLVSITSSGVMWSPEVKKNLLRHHEQLVLIDTFGSSEALGFGGSVTNNKGVSGSAEFKIGERAKVFDEQFNEVQPGSDTVGFIATGGHLPVGYYKDPEKTKRTFLVINGVRYSMPGDYCRVGADGTIILLGRGSACINSAGEKIYSEEVEEALKRHPEIADALVFGIPDEKWGQSVTAVVKSLSNRFDEDKIKAFMRAQLAAYKVPKRILNTQDMGRAVNGKADYDFVRAYALQELGLAS